MQFSATLEARPDSALPPGFTSLYAEHYDFVWRCALRMGAPAAELEDIVQDCFVVALRRYGEFDPRGRGRPSTWLFGILRNVLRNHARASRRRVARLELFGRAHETDEQPPQSAEAALAGRLLDEFLATLDEDKRAAFVLAEIEGMTGPELAAALGLNLNTANSRLRAARQAFVQHFEEREPRRLARAQLGCLAMVQAPVAVRVRGLASVGTAAGTNVGLGASVGALSSKLIAGMIFAAGSIAAVAIVASPRTSEAPVHAANEPAPSPPQSLRPTTHVQAPSEQPPSEPIVVTSEPRERAVKAGPTELEHLADAWKALQDDEPARALEIVETRRFSAKLEGRRVALEIAALCQLDRRTQAQQRARAWREANPEDPNAAALVDVCWSE
jgi:RNA polymerase sigma factor (sigma-70 family)